MKRKVFTIIATLLLSVFASFSMLNPVHSQSLSSATWTEYKFSGDDSFYGTEVVAYESGSNAVLYVNVYNDYGAVINVSSVGISLTWGDTFNSTQATKTSPIVLKKEEYHVFTVTFTVPSTSNVTNFIAWDYTIHVEHVNATGDVVDTKTRTRGNFGLPHFAVYSADQATSRGIAAVIATIPTMTWESASAGILSKKALNETSVAEYYYMLGQFSDAASHYERALSLIDQAFAAEESRATRMEEAEITLVEAEVKFYEGLGNFYNGLSNMWTLIGVALVLFALGYIIRGLAALRRAQVPP